MTLFKKKSLIIQKVTYYFNAAVLKVFPDIMDEDFAKEGVGKTLSTLSSCA